MKFYWITSQDRQSKICENLKSIIIYNIRKL